MIERLDAKIAAVMAAPIGPIELFIGFMVMMILGVSGYELYKRGFRLLGACLGLLAVGTLLILIFLALYFLWGWFYYATGGH